MKKITLLISVSGLLAGPVAAAAQVQAPAVGSEYSFDCQATGGTNFTETYRIESIEGGVVKVAVDNGRQKNWYEKPVAFLSTTLMYKEQIGGKVREMRDIPDSFQRLGALEVGTKFDGHVEERRGFWNRYVWHYKISVLGRETLYNRAYGDLKVIAIDEQRYFDTYTSELRSYYAPRFRFPVFWTYKDANESSVECTLANMRGAAATSVAAARQSAATPTIERTPIEPMERLMMVTTNANVRQQPSTAAPVAGRFGAGSDVRVIGRTTANGERWYQVALTGDKKGFVYGALLSNRPRRAATTPKPAAPAPTKTATRTVPTVPKAAVPKAAAPTGRAEQPAVTEQERLARLDDLLKSGLITRAEHAAKVAEIKDEQPVGELGQALRTVNRNFRLGKLNPEQFIAERAKILAKINPSDMEPKQGLVLLNQLLRDKLISQTEYGRKRQLMIDAI